MQNLGDTPDARREHAQQDTLVHRRAALELRIGSRPAANASSDIRLHQKLANFLAGDAHRHVHEYTLVWSHNI